MAVRNIRGAAAALSSLAIGIAGCGLAPAEVPEPLAHRQAPSQDAAPVAPPGPPAAPPPSAEPRPATASPSPVAVRRLPFTGSSPVATGPAGAVPTDLTPPPSPGPFAINLYRRGDFSSQANERYCVPAAIQTIINVMERGASHSVTAQHRYYRLARRYSTDRLVGAGAEPEGWARTLEVLGHGEYGVVSQRTRARAVHAAAKALRLTGRPVGLLMWRGAHAWVMTGFRATADPAYSQRFQVTHVYVSDVWYPRVSSIWGPSRPPNARVPVDALRADYLRWKRPTARYPEKDGQFVVVLPELPPAG
jgi:hypothetical protein